MPESTSTSFAFERDMLDPIIVRAALLDLVVTLGGRIRIAFQRARIRRITLIAEDLGSADDGPGTQLSLDHAREKRLRLEPVIDEPNARYGHRVAGPAGAYRKAG
ncbi:hypothetical protein [Streptomyces sp. NPDC056543]|uniref:hypothetical protein n=1 Tax=unclassified Streptomyces TaxID=2593676 RepID=UPI003679C39A